MMTLEVMFPVIGETIEKKIEVSSRASINISELESLLAEAQNKLDEQESSSVSDSELSGARFLLNDVCDRFESEKNSEDGKMHLLADIRRSFLEMDKIEDRHSDDQLASEISSKLDKIIIANGLLGENNGDDVERAKK